MKITPILAILVSLLAIIPAVAQQAAAPLTRIGGAGAVRGAVNAIAPNTTVGRVVESGKPIYLNDHITTKADSRLQVMLLDETVFTVGPESDMVLDEFVYDPSTNAGKITARLTKGVFRFVSGKVARQGPDRMKINVPTGTMGIRGTWGACNVGPNLTSVILGGAGPNNTANQPPGHLHLESGKGSVELTRAGYGSDLRFNEPPSRPTDRSGELERIDGVLFWKPKNNQMPNHPPGGIFKADAVQQTGADVLISLNSLQNTKTVTQQSDQNSLTTAQAQQDSTSNNAVVDGLTTWDFITQQLTTGQGTYSGTGAFSCSGVGCDGGNSQMTLSLDINFGARTVGSPSSTLSLITGTDDTNSDSANIPTTSFSNLHGSAVLNVTGGSQGSFSGTTISLLNSGGVVAKMAQVNLSYSSPENTYSGSGKLTVPR